MKKDKYPTLDPREPGIYRRILEAAAEMRSRQQAGVWIVEAQRRAARVAGLQALKREETSSGSAANPWERLP